MVQKKGNAKNFTPQHILLGPFKQVKSEILIEFLYFSPS